MKLNKIETVGDHKIFQIREITDEGGYHRRIITPDMDVSGEVQEIQEKAEKLWTNEVKDNWADEQVKAEAKFQENIKEKE